MYGATATSQGESALLLLLFKIETRPNLGLVPPGKDVVTVNARVDGYVGVSVTEIERHRPNDGAPIKLGVWNRFPGCDQDSHIGMVATKKPAFRRAWSWSCCLARYPSE